MAALCSAPVPFLIARSMLSAGMLAALHFDRIVRSVMFDPGSPPLMRAEIVSSFANLLKTLPRLASAAPFLCLMVDHLLCPLISRHSFPAGSAGAARLSRGYSSTSACACFAASAMIFWATFDGTMS